MAISEEALAQGHTYGVSRMAGTVYCVGCSTFGVTVLTCEFDDED